MDIDTAIWDEKL